MAWQNYYAQPGNAFGIKGPFYGVNGHRGKDYKVAAGTATPAYAGGKVVLIQYSSFLGQCIVIQMYNGLYAGYAHQKRKVNVVLNEIIKPGQSISWVAGRGDEPGSAWDGDHLHTTLSKTKLGIFSGAVLDPGPGISAAIRLASVVADLDKTPIVKPPTPTIPIRRKKSMSTGYWTDRKNRTPAVATDWALAGDGQGKAGWLAVSQPVANELANIHGRFVYLSPHSFDIFKGHYLSGAAVAAVTVNSADGALTTKALEALTMAVKALPAAIVTEEARRLAS